MNKISGIYKIANIINNKVYIGSSSDIRVRWLDHKKELRGNRHSNIHLQNAWNKYSEDNFVFEIVEYAELIKEILLEREQYWMDYLKSYNKKYGYNICRKAGSILGLKRSDEFKQNISNTRKGVNHPMYGKHHTQEAKNNISKGNKGKTQNKTPYHGEYNHNSKLTDEDVYKIKQMLKDGVKSCEITKIFNISKSVISKIKNNISWKHVKLEEE